MDGSVVHPIVSRGERVGQTSKFRCRFCRFPVDANRRSTQQSEVVTDGNSITVDTVNKVASSCQALSGCPNCGSLNWSKRVRNAPIILPEDRIGTAGNRKTYPRR